MPEPQADPNLPQIRRVARHALLAGLVITALKFGAYLLTNSVAVLSDAFESIINLVAASFMLFAIHYANRPPDPDHPYGHGKMQFMAVGLEGWLILLAGGVIAFESVRRLVRGEAPENLDTGLIFIGFIALLVAALAWYVWRSGVRYQSAPLIADGKHLATDAVSTLGVLLGLILVKVTGLDWLDPVVAMVMAGLILGASWKLLWESIHGLMDRADPKDRRRIEAILDEAITAGEIRGYHKARHRHSGAFHWVDVHLQVDRHMTVAAAHALASRIEKRIEDILTPGNATAHIEPFEPAASSPVADEPATDDSSDAAR